MKHQTPHMMEWQDTTPSTRLRLQAEYEWQGMLAKNLQNITRGGETTVAIWRNDPAARYNLPNRMTDDIVLISNAMVGNTTMQELTLRQLHLDEQATMALANGICQSKIKEFELIELTFAEDTSGDRHRIALILRDCMRCSKTFEKLTLVGMGEFTSMFADGLIKTTSLNAFTLKQFGRGLPSVITCDLMRSFYYNNSLTTITFYNQDIDDQVVNVLVESLHPDLPLVNLSLQHNKIGPMGVQVLLRAMAHHKTWSELDLFGNKTIGFDGLRVLGGELQNMHQPGQPGHNITVPKFISVNVRYCVVWNEYKEKEKETEAAIQQDMACKSAEQALFDGVKGNVMIVSLLLDVMAEETLKKMVFFLHLNEMGRYLLGTNHHGLSSTIWCHVLAKCNRYEQDRSHDRWLEWVESVNSVKFYFLREQPHLVVMPRAK